MRIKKASNKLKKLQLSMKSKLVLSFLSIVLVLLVSSIISVMEYSSMSNYVTELIAGDVRSVNVSNNLSEMANTYNLAILEAIGDNEAKLPSFDDAYFKSHCDSLRMSSTLNEVAPLADSLLYSYAAYMLTSMEFEQVHDSEYIDPRIWYFDRLQVRFDRFTSDLNKLTESMFTDLQNHSATFERGFYRSIIPGIVAVGVGILMVCMLLFFLLTDYANPLYKMLAGLRNYRSSDKKYNLVIDGDEQLSELNEGISEITNENQQLRRRLKDLRR